MRWSTGPRQGGERLCSTRAAGGRGARRVCHGLAIALVAATWFVPLQATAREIHVTPKIYFWNTDLYREIVYDSPEEAFEAAKAAVREKGMYYINLRPGDDSINWPTANGFPAIYESDLVYSPQCEVDGSCKVWTRLGARVYTQISCPVDPIFPDGSTTPVYFKLTQTNRPEEINRTYSCIATVPDTEPCDDDCRGNPIHTGTGQKVQVETDYISTMGDLQFQRTYRSTNGSFSSLAASSPLIDHSVPNVTLENCYPSRYASSTGESLFNHCFYYTTKPTAEQRYELTTPDGRLLTFTGPLDAMAPKADVNDKLSQRLNSAGGIEWVAQRADDSTEIYDAKGHLIRKTSLGGKDDITYAYSDAGTSATVAPRAGLLTRMSDRFGRHLHFTYDAQARLAGMTDPAGGTYHYAYDDHGNLSSVTYPDGKVRTYHYNEAAHINNGTACSSLPSGLPHALTGITDENGNRFATYKYNCNGKAVGSEHADGADQFRFTYTSGATAYTGGTTVEVDPLGATRTYHFQQILNVVRPTGTTQQGPDGAGTVSSAVTYDANGNVASRTDFNGVKTTYVYDLARNLETQRVEATGTAQARTISTEWHPTYRLPARIAEPQRITTFTYDNTGNLLSKSEQATTDASGAQGLAATVTGTPRTWRYTYNSAGQVLTAKGPRTDVDDTTSYAYDSQGNLTSVTNAAGHVTAYSNHDPHGRAQRITDPNGVVTELTYSPRGWLTSRSVGGETTSYDYDGVGQLTKVTHPDHSSLTYTYDAAHRLTGVADNLGNSIHYTLDGAGNHLKEEIKDPAGTLARQTTRVYDALNRLREITGALQ